VFRHLPKLLAMLLTAALVVGCGGSGGSILTRPAPDPLAGMPAPASPSGVVRAFEWGIDQRSVAAYQVLFTGDFVFHFDVRDSSASEWDDAHPWGRTQEEAYFATLVHGGDADQPAAAALQLMLDHNLTVLNDPRTGKEDPVRRKSVTTQVYFTITTTDGAATALFGSTTFYLVRGDIATIPAGLGLAPDSTRWYIEGWDDGTNGSAGLVAAPQPAKNKTWGGFKELYLPPSLRSYPWP
jgi:hypothetical protein